MGGRASSRAAIEARFFMDEQPVRKKPVHGVIPYRGQTTIVFVTACVKDRKPILATHKMHENLVGVWRGSAHWLVGRYVVMPDHVHFFVSPTDKAGKLEEWMGYWKRRFAKRINRVGIWQSDHWDTRLRSVLSYHEKWEYVRSNPVRHGLVETPEDWPYQGEIFELQW